MSWFKMVRNSLHLSACHASPDNSSLFCIYSFKIWHLLLKLCRLSHFFFFEIFQIFSFRWSLCVLIKWSLQNPVILIRVTIQLGTGVCRCKLDLMTSNRWFIMLLLVYLLLQGHVVRVESVLLCLVLAKNLLESLFWNCFRLNSRLTFIKSPSHHRFWRDTSRWLIVWVSFLSQPVKHCFFIVLSLVIKVWIE